MRNDNIIITFFGRKSFSFCSNNMEWIMNAFLYIDNYILCQISIKCI